MCYTVDTLKRVLSGLGDGPDRIIYTENFDDQITRRNISDLFVESAKGCRKNLI